jgi:hypothetical protein
MAREGLRLVKVALEVAMKVGGHHGKKLKDSTCLSDA